LESHNYRSLDLGAEKFIRVVWGFMWVLETVGWWEQCSKPRGATSRRCVPCAVRDEGRPWLHRDN